MARMAGVPFLGIADNGAMSAWDIVCVHTIVGYQSGGNAAHFTTGAGGQIVQARDTRFRSAANLNGNWHVIAIENEDHGSAYGSWSGSNVPRFSAAQAEAVAKILVWANQVHGIPLSLIPDTKPGRRGVAYHRQGIDGNYTGPYGGRLPGGEIWSTKIGKVCPGDNRIAQVINEIIPRARVLAGQGQQHEEEDMALASIQWEPGEKKWGVLAVPPVGGSLSVPAGGQAWLHLRVPHQPVTLHGLWTVDDKGAAHELINPESQLPYDTYNRWQLPTGTTQVSVQYTAEVPIGATLETKAA